MPSRQRYLLTGALIGLYFGFFFRPVREPSLLFVVGLSFVAAVVTVLFAWRGGRLRRPLWHSFLISWGQFGLVLAVFEGRHLAYDSAGRPGTVLFTTVLGALIGLWYWFTAADSSA